MIVWASCFERMRRYNISTSIFTAFPLPLLVPSISPLLPLAQFEKILTLFVRYSPSMTEESGQERSKAPAFERATTGEYSVLPSTSLILMERDFVSYKNEKAINQKRKEGR